jgi:hypothetical protein
MGRIVPVFSRDVPVLGSIVRVFGRIVHFIICIYIFFIKHHGYPNLERARKWPGIIGIASITFTGAVAETEKDTNLLVNK